MPGGARTQLTFFPDRVAEPATIRTSATISSSAKTSAAASGSRSSASTSSGNTTMLTDGKSRNTARLVEQGRSHRLRSTRRNKADLDFYVMDPTDKSSDKMIARKSRAADGKFADWSPDDETLLGQRSSQSTRVIFCSLDAATGKKTELTPKGAERSSTSRRIQRDGKGLYVTTDKDNEFHAPRLHGPGDESRARYLTTLQVGCRRQHGAPLVGPPFRRVHPQRERTQPHCMSSTRRRAKNSRRRSSRPEPSATSAGTRTIQIWRSPSPAPSRPSDVYSVDLTSGKTGSLDHQRNRRTYRQTHVEPSS